jgi:hypothetical protein
VIAEMLGTPPADHERIRQLSGTVVRSLEPVNDPDTAAAIAAADAELTQIAAEMIAGSAPTRPLTCSPRSSTPRTAATCSTMTS